MAKRGESISAEYPFLSFFTQLTSEIISQLLIGLEKKAFASVVSTSEGWHSQCSETLAFFRLYFLKNFELLHNYLSRCIIPKTHLDFNINYIFKYTLY